MLSNQFRHVYQFRIVLKDTKPPIWRRIQVPDNYSFKDLHVVIQNLMDWEDDFDPNYFDRDNVFFTAGSGNPPLPDDLPERLMKIFK